MTKHNIYKSLCAKALLTTAIFGGGIALIQNSQVVNVVHATDDSDIANKPVPALENLNYQKKYIVRYHVPNGKVYSIKIGYLKRTKDNDSSKNGYVNFIKLYDDKKISNELYQIMDNMDYFNNDLYPVIQNNDLSYYFPAVADPDDNVQPNLNIQYFGYRAYLIDKSGQKMSLDTYKFNNKVDYDSGLTQTVPVTQENGENYIDVYFEKDPNQSFEFTNTWFDVDSEKVLFSRQNNIFNIDFFNNGKKAIFVQPLFYEQDKLIIIPADQKNNIATFLTNNESEETLKDQATYNKIFSKANIKEIEKSDVVGSKNSDRPTMVFGKANTNLINNVNLHPLTEDRTFYNYDGTYQIIPTKRSFSFKYIYKSYYQNSNATMPSHMTNDYMVYLKHNTQSFDGTNNYATTVLRDSDTKRFPKLYLDSNASLTNTQKQVKRNITVIKDGSTKTTTQNVTFNRKATYDLVNGKFVKYEPWIKDATTQGFTEFTPETIDNYDYEIMDNKGNQLQSIPNENNIDANSSDEQYYIVYTKKSEPATTNLTKAISRTVNIINPIDNSVKTVTQTAHFSRTGNKDLTTGQTTYSDYTSTDNNLKQVTVPEITGYKASVTDIPNISLTANSDNEVVDVVYTPNKEQINVVYKDGENTVKTDTIKGIFNQTVGINSEKLPIGYELANPEIDSKKTVKLGENNPDVVVQLKHQTEPVLKDVSKEVSRTINVIDPLTNKTRTDKKQEYQLPDKFLEKKVTNNKQTDFTKLNQVLTKLPETETQPTQVIDKQNTNEKQAKTLPNTGSSQSNLLTAISLSLLSLTGLYTIKKRKKNN